MTDLGKSEAALQEVQPTTMLDTEQHEPGPLVSTDNSATTTFIAESAPSSEISHDIKEKDSENVPLDQPVAYSGLEVEKKTGYSEEVQDAGLGAWMTVVGAWLILFASIGNIYSFGVYQDSLDYYSRFFLRQFTPSQIGWMGSVLLMLPFAGGIVAGKLFDKGYFRHVVLTGSVLILFSLFMLSLAKEGQYYQDTYWRLFTKVFLSQSVGVGLGGGLILAPTTGIVSLHFTKNRNLAYGITLTGVSVGAVVLPIALNHLIPRIGFAQAVRVDAYIALGCLVVGNALLRLPEAYKNKKPTVVNVVNFFRDPAYVTFIVGSMMVAFGIYFPLVYMQLYSILHHIDTNLAFYSLAIINGASALGRIGANYFADRYGVWKLQVPTTLLAGVSIWSMLTVKDKSSMIAVSFFYGIFSGAWLSLAMGALASLATCPQEIGARIGVALAICSLGLLGSIPAQGALLTDRYLWARPVTFSGSMMFGASILYALTWWIVVRKKNAQTSTV
ncbi:MFS general substrate transporter [Agrocybe pediades]|nr:MFS general substrate transporter [Agrocybe pediades]